MHLLETIRIEGGTAHLLDYHEERIARSLYYQGHRGVLPFSVHDIVRQALSRQSIERDVVYKLRFEYDVDYLSAPELIAYQPKSIERLVLSNILDAERYNHKWANRSALYHSLIDAHTEVIFMHQGLLTDTSYSNLVLEMADGQMLSPRRPLLRGLMREYLLDQGKIDVMDLSRQHLLTCRRIYLVNAMLPLGRLGVEPTIVV